MEKSCPYSSSTNVFLSNRDDVTHPSTHWIAPNQELNLATPQQALHRWLRWNKLQVAPEVGAIYARMGNIHSEIKSTEELFFAHGHGGLRRVVERMTGLLDKTALPVQVQLVLQEYDERIANYQQAVKPLRDVFEQRYGKMTSFNRSKSRLGILVPQFSNIKELIDKLQTNNDSKTQQSIECAVEKIQQHDHNFKTFLENKYMPLLSHSPNITIGKGDQSHIRKNNHSLYNAKNHSNLLVWQMFHQASQIQLDTTKIPVSLSDLVYDVCGVTESTFPKFTHLLEEIEINETPLVVQTLHEQMAQTSRIIAQKCLFSVDDLNVYHEHLKILDLDTEDKRKYYSEQKTEAFLISEMGGTRCPLGYRPGT